MQLTEKLSEYIKVSDRLNEIQAEAALKAAEYKEKIKAEESHLHALKAMIENEHKETGICEEKINGVTFTLGYRKSPPKVVCENEADIPEEFVRVKVIREPDKVAIRNFLKEAETPVNWASLQRGADIFEIKAKV